MVGSLPACVVRPPAALVMGKPPASCARAPALPRPHAPYPRLTAVPCRARAVSAYPQAASGARCAVRRQQPAEVQHAGRSGWRFLRDPCQRHARQQCREPLAQCRARLRARHGAPRPSDFSATQHPASTASREAPSGPRVIIIDARPARRPRHSDRPFLARRLLPRSSSSVPPPPRCWAI